MTFLHKLARRLASARWIAFGSTLVMACTKGTERDFLSPNPGTSSSSIVAIAVSPRAGTVKPEEVIHFTATGTRLDGRTTPVDVDWAASGGTIAPDGTFISDKYGRFQVTARLKSQPALADSATVAVFVSPKDILTVSVSPDSAVITAGEGVQLGATATLADGTNVTSPPLSWAASAGIIDGNGWFVPGAEGLYSVTATASTGATGSAKIQVKSNKRILTRLTISPNSSSLTTGQSKKFDATATWSDGSTSSVNADWSATGGAIAGDGTYSAGTTPGNYKVAARAKNSPISDTAFVSITEPTLQSFAVSPKSVTLAPGATQQYTPTATMSDGSTRTIGVSWQGTGGTISTSGLYTAGQTEGTFKVVGAVSGTSFADTSVVTIARPVVTLSTLILNPSSASVPAGSTRQFSVTGTYSDGSTGTPAVTWSATGGTITAGGLFTAGTSQGSFQVTATQVGGTKTATSAVTVTAPVLTALVLNPSTVTLQPGQAQLFSVSGSWSDGGTAAPAVTWTVSGGTMAPDGTFTAGTTAGTFRVIATQQGGTLADTSLVTVSIPAPVLQSVTIAPHAVSLQPGATYQFTAGGTWSDGSSTPPQVTWSATGGTVSASGLYTAGSATGSFRVRATQTGGTLADSATVTISTAAPVLTALTISPSSTSLQTSASRQFTVSGTYSDGSTGTPAVTWTATGGTVTNGGLYVAGTTAGTWQVTATQSGGTIAATATVTVTQPVTLVSIAVSPDSSTLQPGATKQYAATGTYSNGGTGTPTVTWSATGGSVSGTGLYTAGSTSGNFRVSATSGSVVGSASLAVTGATVSSFVLSPATVSLATGATQQFSTTLTWSDGATHPATITYSATGGTISATGLYTAGQLAGTFLAIASCSCGGVDTSVITLTAPAAVLSSLAITPKNTSVASGTSQQFSATATWSDGSTTVPPLTYAATGGTITAQGQYTAGSTLGTYAVVVSSGTKVDTATVTVTTAPPWVAAPAELPRVLLQTAYQAPTGRVISVAAGGNLQNAINSAACGDEIQLAQGAVFVGNYVLPARQCVNNPIHIRTAGTLPPEGVRVSPTTAASFAKIMTPNSDAALKGAPGARGYRILALEVSATTATTLNYGLLRVGEANESSVDSLPGYVVLDRLYVHGYSTLGVSRCLAFNGVATSVVDSYISECHGSGFDAQAVGGWTGPGPFKITNNYLEGSGENILFGGAPSRFAGVNPSDIEVRRNFITKPLAWLTSGTWSVKNLFELKNASRVLVEGNVFRNNWRNAQNGYAILFQSLNDGAAGSTNSAVVQDVTFRLNRVSVSANGLVINADARYQNDGPVLPAQRFLVENNLFEAIGRSDLLGDNPGVLLQVLGGTQGLRDIVFNHNTLLHASVGQMAVSLANAVSSHMVLTNSLMTGGQYGLFGSSVGEGTPALNAYWGTWLVRGNAFVGRPGNVYPSGNFFPSSLTSLGLDADGRLSATSGLNGMATDGTDVGANITALLQAISGVAP